MPTTRFALVLVAASVPALATDLNQCQLDARNLMKNMEVKGGSYFGSFDRFEQECVTNGKELQGLPGYAEVKAAWEHLKPIADRADAEMQERVFVNDMWFWVQDNIGPGSDYLLSDLKGDKNGATYKQATAKLAECEAKLQAAFAKYPNSREATDKNGELTLGQAWDFCHGGAIAKADSAKADWDKGQVEHGLKSIMETESRFQYAVKSLAEIKKLLPGRYGAMAAVSEYEFILPDLSKVGAAIEYAATYSPTIKAQTIDFAGKKWVVRDLHKYAWATYEQVKASNEALRSKAEAQESQWTNEFNSRVQGDRKAIARKYGVPSAFDGGDFADPAKRLDMLVSKGTFWLYQDGGCETKYTFRGNTKASKQVTPRGCTD